MAASTTVSIPATVLVDSTDLETIAKRVADLQERNVTEATFQCYSLEVYVKADNCGTLYLRGIKPGVNA